MSVTWDAGAYETFGDHRGRPLHDLVARIEMQAPGLVVDAGCGPGTLTPALAARWPHARIEAFDSSPEMVSAARARGIDAHVQDVTTWEPAGDVVVANAVLQWVPGHPELMARWARELAGGTWVAVQVPGNFDAPSHALTRELASESAWMGELEGVLRGAETVLEPTAYAELLIAEGCAVDAWETTYAQRLTGDDPVLRWITGTALRPVRSVLSEERWTRFREELAPRLRAAYPRGSDGATWMPFRRIFVVAVVGGHR